MSGCTSLREGLLATFGPTWRATLFGSSPADEEDGFGTTARELQLLLGLADPRGPEARLCQLLGAHGWMTQFAWRLLRAWQRRHQVRCFPPADVAGRLLLLVRLCCRATATCPEALRLGAVPVSLLAILHLRLGCTFSSATCGTPVCWLGSRACTLAAAPTTAVLLTERDGLHDLDMRMVYLTHSEPVREAMPVVTLRAVDKCGEPTVMRYRV